MCLLGPLGFLWHVLDETFFHVHLAPPTLPVELKGTESSPCFFCRRSIPEAFSEVLPSLSRDNTVSMKVGMVRDFQEVGSTATLAGPSEPLVLLMHAGSAVDKNARCVRLKNNGARSQSSKTALQECPRGLYGRMARRVCHSSLGSKWPKVGPIKIS